MTISGPSPLPPIQRSDDANLALRLNQRIAAEVLQVSGDRVALVIEGVRVVARLTANEQAAMLEEHRLANFIVRDLSGPVVTLQLMPQAAPQAPIRPVPELIPNLLQVSGIPVNEWTLNIARALLNQGLPVTLERVAELQDFLAEIQGWGQQHAQYAVAIKSAGLPLTPAALELVMQQPASITSLIAQLTVQIQAMLRRKQTPESAALLQDALTILQGTFIQMGDPEALKQGLQRALHILGHSLESSFNKLAQANLDTPTPGQSSLLTLVALRQQLVEQHEDASVGDLDRFLDGLRANQFLNTPPEREPDKGRWLNLELPLSLPGSANSSQAAFTPARIRIAYPTDPEKQALDPANTRLVIGVEIAPGSFLQVDLSVVNQRVGAYVLATNDDLRAAAEEELPALTSGLEQLGYTIQSSACRIKPSDQDVSQQPQTLWSSFNEVFVET